MPRLTGTVAAGLGRGGDFVALPWVFAGFTALLGAAPHPGTLNLAVGAEAVDALRRGAPAMAFPAGQPGFCDAVVHRVRAAGLPALAVFPDVADYPPGKLELVVAGRLPVSRGDPVVVEW